MKTETRVCKICGAEFTTDNSRKIYCSAKCKNKGSDELKKHPRVKVYAKQPKITIYDMVEEMLRLSEEYGRSVQYGELSEMLLTGRHTIKKRGAHK